MSRFWSPDESNFVLADDLASAKQVFHEYMEYLPEDDSDWKEYPLHHVVVVSGGYDLGQLLGWSNAKAPHFFGNIEDEYNNIGEMIE